MRDKVVEGAVQLLCDMGQMLTRSALEEPDIKVGLEAKVGHVVRLLTAEGSNSMVLLHGMAGIGKTTLARAVFNRLQESNPTLPCCFLGLDPYMKEEDITKQQRQLLTELAHVEGSPQSKPEGGRDELAQRLMGKRVLLMVDNAWDDVLEFLLPRNFMRLLGEGSMVLVTSREKGAAKEQAWVVEIEMEYLSPEQSAELFCKYGFPGPALAPRSSWMEYVAQSQWTSHFTAALKVCAGLPMALEVVGRYFAAIADKGEFYSTFQKACSKQKAGRKEAERTLFGALRLSWSILEPDEQDALLDIASMLNGQPWDWVQHHCGSFVLGRLCGLGLVKQQDGERQSHQNRRVQLVTVHDTVSTFCSDATAIRRPPRRTWVTRSSQLQQVTAPAIGGQVAGCTCGAGKGEMVHSSLGGGGGTCKQVAYVLGAVHCMKGQGGASRVQARLSSDGSGDCMWCQLQLSSRSRQLPCLVRNTTFSTLLSC
jgi:hypothetical protein